MGVRFFASKTKRTRLSRRTDCIIKADSFWAICELFVTSDTCRCAAGKAKTNSNNSMVHGSLFHSILGTDCTRPKDRASMSAKRGNLGKQAYSAPLSPASPERLRPSSNFTNVNRVPFLLLIAKHKGERQRTGAKREEFPLQQTARSNSDEGQRAGAQVHRGSPLVKKAHKITKQQRPMQRAKVQSACCGQLHEKERATVLHSCPTNHVNMLSSVNKTDTCPGVGSPLPFRCRNLAALVQPWTFYATTGS